MAHSHSHDNHPHDHAHPVPSFNKAFLIAIIANGLYVVFQIIYAYVANSTSLLADAMHNLGDVLGLVMAWVANGLLTRRPTPHSTYGMKKTSILAALGNGLLLVFTCGIIATEAIYKLFSPSAMYALSVMVVAGIGILINGSTALLFLRGSNDINIRAAYLHLVYDALISIGVVIAAGIIYLTGWQWLDPVVGLLIAITIMKGTWALFADSFRMIIDGVPRGIVITDVHALLMEQEGVSGLHDLHVWAMSTQENALSVHLWMPDSPLTDEARHILVDTLRKKHQIHHVTIQVEQVQGHCDDVCIPYLD